MMFVKTIGDLRVHSHQTAEAHITDIRSSHYRDKKLTIQTLEAHARRHQKLATDMRNSQQIQEAYKRQQKD